MHLVWVAMMPLLVLQFSSNERGIDILVVLEMSSSTVCLENLQQHGCLPRGLELLEISSNGPKQPSLAVIFVVGLFCSNLLGIFLRRLDF